MPEARDRYTRHGKMGYSSQIFPRTRDPFCHLVKIPSSKMRGDYSAPRDLECVSNRLARSTREPSTSLAANIYRYIITRQVTAVSLYCIFLTMLVQTLERNVGLLYCHDAVANFHSGSLPFHEASATIDPPVISSFVTKWYILLWKINSK